MTDIIHEMLQEHPYLIADGAMGTNLFKRGLESGDAPELWNVDHPERIESVHQEFVDAGSDIILTNSFGCNKFRLKLHNAESRVYELAKAAAQIARKVADSADRKVLVGGSMGPSGELLEPVGTLTFDDAKNAFAEQARGLVDGGVDVLWIETMSSREEAAAAIAGAATTGKPVVSTMTFDTAGKTMMGVSPSQAYEHLSTLPTPPVAMGANCGLGPTESVLSLLSIGKVKSPDALIVAKANCGVPEFKGGQFVYTGTPELMGKYARMAVDSGARIIGGCCGSDGTIIKAIKDSLEGYAAGEAPTREKVIEVLGPLANIGSDDDAPACGHDHGGGRSGRRRRRG